MAEMLAMTKPVDYRDSATRHLVVGLGKTGLSCARYLSAQGQQVAVTDSRESPPGLHALRAELPDVALFLGGFEDSVFGSADYLVVSPGVPVATPEIQTAKDHGVRVIGDVELFATAAAAPVAAITGSNGKSTVTTLLGLMARESGRKTAVGGNLGEPVLDLLADDVELYVVELSSFQLETTSSLQPAVATILNISADHMDRYSDLADYMAAKARILSQAQALVWNLDDPLVMSLQHQSGSEAEQWFFTRGEAENSRTFGLRRSGSELWLCRGQTQLISASELKMGGQHNLANALAALAMGTALGLGLKPMLKVLREFPGLPHRTEYLGSINGVVWYNDSKATNVGACVAALEGLHRGDDSRTVLIAGGDCKQADFSQLGPVMARCARALILIGRDADMIAAVAPAQVPVSFAENLTAAVNLAARQAQGGDRVLLAPACASFDMYRNYEQRGDAFRKAVRELMV